MDSSRTSDDSDSTESTDPKDKGYAWVVLLSAIGLRMLLAGPDGIMGVMLLDLTYRFQASEALLNTTVSMQFGIALFGSILSSIIMARFGCRPIVCMGAVIVSLGYASSAFITEIYGLLIMYGIVAALGLSTFSMGSVIAAQTYFNKHRGLAQGALMSAFGAAGFMWPPLSEYLLRHYSLSGTLLIFAAIQLQGCVFGAMLRPFSLQTKFVNSRKRILKAAIYTDGGLMKSEGDSISWHSDGKNARSDDVKKDKPMDLRHNVNDVCKKGKKGEKSKLDDKQKSIFRIMKNYHFLLFCISSIFGFFGYSLDYLYLPKIGVHFGASDQQGAFLVSILSITNCIFRLVSGIIADIPVIKPHRTWGIITAYVLAGVLKILFLLTETYIHVAVYAAAQGICVGTYMGLLYTVGIDIAGQDHVALASGMVALAGGVALLASAPLAGLLEEMSGGLNLPFIAMGAIQISGGLMVLLNYWHMRKMTGSNTYDIESHQSDEGKNDNVEAKAVKHIDTEKLSCV